MAFKFGQKLLVHLGLRLTNLDEVTTNCSKKSKFLSKYILNVHCTVAWEILAPLDVFTAPLSPSFCPWKSVGVVKTSKQNACYLTLIQLYRKVRDVTHISLSATQENIPPQNCSFSCLLQVGGLWPGTLHSVASACPSTQHQMGVAWNYALCCISLAFY